MSSDVVVFRRLEELWEQALDGSGPATAKKKSFDSGELRLPDGTAITVSFGLARPREVEYFKAGVNLGGPYLSVAIFTEDGARVHGPQTVRLSPEAFADAAAQAVDDLLDANRC